MRRSILLVVGLISVNAGLLVILVWKERPSALLAEIQECFKRIPNIEITEIVKPPAEFLDSAAVTVAIRDKGEIGFSGLRGRSFKSSSHIHLYKIGNYSLRSRVKMGDQEYFGYDIDVGVDSPVPAIRALKIRNVASAISHYDELLNIVSDWPKSEANWPKTSEEVHFPAPPKADYFFSLHPD